MPLTLAFEPENMENPNVPDEWKPIVLIQPSAEEAGRIFAGINPFGKAVGVHLLPEEAARVRDHLSKLLLEPDKVAEAAPAAPNHIDRIAAELRSDEPRIDWSEKIAAAAQRATARTPEQTLTRASAKRTKAGRWFQFRLEFHIGRAQGIIARTNDT